MAQQQQDIAALLAQAMQQIAENQAQFAAQIAQQQARQHVQHQELLARMAADAAQRQAAAPGANPILHANRPSKQTSYPKSDGANDLRRWMQAMEAAFIANGVENENVRLTLCITEGLTGAPLSWLMENAQGEEAVQTWNDLKDALIANFQRPDEDLYIIEQLSMLRMTADVDKYIDSFLALSVRARDLGMASKIAYFLNGLPERLRERVRETAPATFDEAMSKARAFTAATPAYASQSRAAPAAFVAAPAYTPERPSMDVDAWSGDRRRGGSSWRPAHGDGATRRPGAGSRRCWRCQKEGHTAPSCRAPEPVPRPHDA